jgi:dephospho-CoA kinase
MTSAPPSSETARRPFVLGLTGSIAMGKSTTAAMFREAGLPVWDADAAVHRLYSAGGAAVAAIAALCPGAVVAGAVDRSRLRRAIAADPDLLGAVEAAVHPLVAADRQAFLDAAAAAQAPIAVLEAPLLFESGLDRDCDAVAVVTAPAERQAERLQARGLAPAEAAALLARQMPDAEKRARAQHVIPTDTLDGARAAVQDLLARIGVRET